jgi:mono/diheme cytochrome c family protein
LGPLRGAALAVVVAALPTAACGGSSKADKAAQARAGSTLFANTCAVCHGSNGTGGSAPVLNAKEMLSNASDQQLRNIIRVGIPGTRMQSWGQEFGGPFDDKTVDEVVAYLRSLEPHAPSVPDWRLGKTGGAAPSTSSTTPSSSTSP